MIITGWHFINTPCWHWKGGDPVTSAPGHCRMVIEVVYVRGGGHPTLSLQTARVHLSVSSDDNCRQRWIHGWIYINMSCFYFYSVEGRLRMGKYPPMLLRVLLVTSLLCRWSLCSHLSRATEQLPLPCPRTSSWLLDPDWLIMVTWPEYWSLYGWGWHPDHPWRQICHYITDDTGR